MKYNPPKDSNGNPYYIPVVTKNRDYLLGYLFGIETVKDLMSDVMDAADLDIDLGPIDVILDSTRYNNILEGGKRESDMSDSELKEYILNIVENVTARLNSESEENGIKSTDVLTLECSCGFGYYSWKTYSDIPTETYKCSNCGKVIIDYTDIDDYKFEYDGGEDEY